MKSNDYLVTIIVPVYNAEAYLKRCVDSLINQTYTNLEILLIDDGSEDSSGGICDFYSKYDSRIMAFHTVNQGQAAARNFGISKANGDYIGFVDSDDWVELDMYQRLLNSIDKCDIAVCGRFVVYEKRESIKKMFCFNKSFTMDSYEAIKRFLLSDGLDGSPCDKLFKKGLLKELSFPLGYICEDLPFIYEALLNSKRICHIGVPCYYYLQRDGSTTHSHYSKKTDGLVKYPMHISKDVIIRYPTLTNEAMGYYVKRLFVYWRICADSHIKIGKSYKFKLRYYKYISFRERIIISLIKCHLYNFFKQIFKK